MLTPKVNETTITVHATKGAKIMRRKSKVSKFVNIFPYG